MAESIPPLRVREADGSPNIIPVFDMIFSGATVSAVGAGVIQVLVDSGGGGTTYVLGTPVLVGSGGTGQLTFPAFGLLYGSGASAVQALMALSAGSLVCGSGVTTRPHVLGSGATGQQLISTGGVVGNLAWVNTLGGASATVYSATGNAYITYDAAGDLTAERVLTSGTGLAVASDATNFFVSLVTPVVVPSGGTGAATFASFGFLYGSGASAIQALMALSAGSLVCGSGVTTRAHVLGSGATGQQLISTGGVVGNLAWVNTLGGASATIFAATGNQYLTISAAADLTDEYLLAAGTGTIVTSASNVVFVSNSAKQVRVPLALLTVQPDSGNAFWSAATWPLLDEGFVAFVDLGEGMATFWTMVPLNLHPDPNWNLTYYHQPNAGAGGNAIVTTRAAAYSHAETAAYTLVASAGSYATQAMTALAIAAVSGANFDSVLALSGGDLLYVEVNRHGGNANDTVGTQWNLKGVALDCNVL